MRCLTACTLAMLSLGCAQTHDLPLPEGAYLIQDRRLSEMSGLEASPSRPGEFWSINDSGSLPRLYRIGPRGEALGRVSVRGAWIRDSETLAIYRAPGRDWLLIGDVGDNRGRRGEVRVHAVPEPAPGQRHVDIAWTLRFTYPDGPRDAEGIAVDHLAGDVLVVTKRDVPARLYRVPLAARHSPGVAVAEFVGSVVPGSVPAEVTGLDLSKDGRRLLALTYRQLHMWERDPGEPWSEVLAQSPRSWDLPGLSKAEAMAFDARDERVLIGSERLPTPFVELTLQ